MDHNHSHSATNRLVSVVIPTYNYAQFVTHTIACVTAQEYKSVEIIVVDDGSTDGTQMLLESRADIRYIRQENRGLSAARNRGIDAASGEFILFLDADDLIARDSIAQRVEALCRDNSISFVVCRSQYFESGKPERAPGILLREWKLPEEEAVDLALCFFNIAPPHAFLVRRDVINHHTLRFDTRLRACEDYDFWFRLSLLTKPPYLVRTTRVYYRQHATSMSRALANQAGHDAILCERILTAFESSSTWLGDRSRFNYLYPMFASALLTARKLWRTDKDVFTTFLAGHAEKLRRQLAEVFGTDALDPDCIAYIASSKLSALRMLIHDDSIDRLEFSRAIACLPDIKTCSRRLFLTLWRDPRGLSRLLHYLASELRYLTLYTLHYRYIRG